MIVLTEAFQIGLLENVDEFVPTFARARSSADTSAAWHRPRGSWRFVDLIITSWPD